MDKLLNCDITGLNKKKKIFHYFGIPEEAQKDDYDFSTNYSYKFIKKNPDYKYSSVEEFFLSLQKKNPEILDKLPEGSIEADYRPIINYEYGSSWLKKAQKKFHKIIVKSIKDVPYLHSTLKGTSYSTNGIAHSRGKRYILCLDISGFFTQIKIERVYKTIKYYLGVDSDVARFYSKMLTTYKENDSKDLVLAQGLPSSPILAFLCFKSLFDHIYEYSISNDINFTLYVDDMTFSCKDPIPQDFMDRLFGVIKGDKCGNRLKLNRKKIHYLSRNNWKKITGVCIVDGKPKIPNRKHFELHVLYKKILYLLHNNLNTFEEYCYFCKYFEKFSGNLLYLIAVEYSNDMELIKTSINRRHAHMYKFYNIFKRFIRPGLVFLLEDGSIDYKSINSFNLTELQSRFNELIRIKTKLQNTFQMIN